MRTHGGSVHYSVYHTMHKCLNNFKIMESQKDMTIYESNCVDLKRKLLKRKKKNRLQPSPPQSEIVVK